MNYYNYFTEIEETFVRRRGKNLLLSPLDWALIETWQERKMPLHIVLRAIEKVFDTVDKQTARKRTVKSLMYCREEIEAQYSEWLESQIGKDGGEETLEHKAEADESLFSHAAVETHLKQVASDLENAKKNAKGDLRETLERVLNRLAELEKHAEGSEKLEESLDKLDALIDAGLLESDTAKDSKREIEMQLAAYKNKMETEVYRRTFDLMLLKKLREQTAIPRLSLFYL
ncbi:MAG: hypothetical protein M3525_01315 [Acidobacteriota bacterium]|nr:hypothetical protein [Acidobacteriota bacterium]